MKPIIKWAGGKTRLLPELVGTLPTDNVTGYYEPMCGGAALFWQIPTTCRREIADANPHLINMYRMVQTYPAALCEYLYRYQQEHNELFYYRIRDYWNDRLDESPSTERAAMFIYLNKACYNGLWRVNKSGSFNVPYCKNDNVPIFDEVAIFAASKQLADVVILHGDYADTTVEVPSGALVYFDPPYDKLKADSFTAYTADEFDHGSLSAYAVELSERGCYVMLSNADTPRVRRLYPNWNLHEVTCSRPISSDGAKRGKVAELIITNY